MFLEEHVLNDVKTPQGCEKTWSVQQIEMATMMREAELLDPKQFIWWAYAEFLAMKLFAL